MNNKKIKSLGLILIAAVLAIVGIAAWIYQLLSGMHVTNLNQDVVWGLYIAAFFIAVGAGAALLALVAFSEFSDSVCPYSKAKVLVMALSAFIVGGILITMDLGNPISLFLLVSSFQLESMMVLDFWLLALCVVVGVLYLLRIKQQGVGGKFLGIAALTVAALVVIIESFMLTSLAAKEMWSSAIIVVSFLASAAIAGYALLLVVLPKVKNGRRILLNLLILGLMITLLEVITGVLTGNPQAKKEMLYVLAGKIAPFFWGQIIFGFLIPLFMLSRFYRPAIIALLALVGGVFGKVWMLTAGQAGGWLKEAFSFYSPSIIEYLTVIGAAAIGVVLFLLLQNIFKIKNSTSAKERAISTSNY